MQAISEALEMKADFHQSKVLLVETENQQQEEAEAVVVLALLAVTEQAAKQVWVAMERLITL